MRRPLFAVAVTLLLCAVGALPLSARPSSITDVFFNSMVQADRAFAAKSRAEGIKASFLAYLAQDSIIFLPGPIDAYPYYQGRTFISSLDWGPAAGEVSALGDFGYTVGPGIVTVPQASGPPLRFGTYYLSIWERDRQGRWKVQLDDGIGVDQQPLPADTVRRGPEARPSAPPRSVERNSRLQQLTRTDRALVRALASNPATAYAGFRRDDCLFLRDGELPVAGAAADPLLATFPARGLDGLELARMAASADLAYTSGTSGDAVPTHYVRVWRYADGRWWLVADLTTYA